MAGQLQPLVDNQRIVRTDGTPTEYFIRWAQQRQIDIAGAVSAEQALEIAQEYVLEFLTDNPLLAGNGIDLSPSGNIAEGVTISAEVQEILDQISAVQGSVLFRGATAWEALAPGTAGDFLQTGGAGANPAWAAGGGGGGGSTGEAPWITPTVAGFTTRVGTGAFADYAEGVIVTAPGTVGNVNNVNRATVPIVAGAGGWQATARFKVHFPQCNWPMAGMVVRNSGSGAMEMLSLGNDAIIGINRNTYSNDTTFVSVSGIVARYNPDLWMRVKDNLTNRIWYTSEDGYFWQQIFIESRTNFLTPNQVGFQLNPNTGGPSGGSANVQNRNLGFSVLSWQFQSLP